MWPTGLKSGAPVMSGPTIPPNSGINAKVPAMLELTSSWTIPYSCTSKCYRGWYPMAPVFGATKIPLPGPPHYGKAAIVLPLK